MAVFTGTGGAVKIGANTVAEIDSWDVTPGTKDADITKFGDTWEENLPILTNWTAKISGRFDPTDTNGQLALWTAFTGRTTVAIELDIDGTHHFSGSGYVTPSYKTAVSAVATADYTIKGTGALTLV